VHLDPEVAAVLVALALGGAPGLYTGRKTFAARRRARRFCAACGRRILNGERTCGCQ